MRRRSHKQRPHSSKTTRSRGKASRALRAKRGLSFESLECRRLLVGEGAEFSVSETFNTTGLVGSLQSTVRWGDGTETPGTVAGNVDNNGPLSIRFVYRGSFFNDAARRTALETAAASIIERFNDDLAAITPNSLLTWDATLDDPTTGSQLVVPNLSVAANELVIYVGGRDLPGSRVGEAGPGGFAFAGGGSYTQEQINQINEFLDVIRYRGEPGANLTNPTDFGPWGGSIAFDTQTNWHFGLTTDGLDDDEVDFMSIAGHELMHVLGFGVIYGGSTNSSYETYSNGTQFTGPAARANYGGAVPLANANHLSGDITSRGQVPLISPEVPKGERKILTPLDLATLDDLGWDVRPSTTATVTATHNYADNPDEGNQYPVEVVLRGSQFGQVINTATATVTNVNPTLTIPDAQMLQIGQSISITNIGQISDPGYRNAAAQSEETFTYTINWGDGSTVDEGSATIDRQGSATVDTLASFNGSHLYESVGTYTVRVSVTDDDGGTANANFTITVTPPPVLSLSVSAGSVREDAGSDAATLTIVRSGPVSDSNQTITLSSSDAAEATVPSTAVILAGEDRVSVPITAVDDTLFDGTQDLTFNASAPNTDPGEVAFQVRDYETIDAVFTAEAVRENDPNSVKLRLSRSNTDGDLATFAISGGNASQLDLPSSVEIPAGQTFVDVDVAPIDDAIAELTLPLNFSIALGGYTGVTAAIDLLDDEPPKFQNPQNRYDVDGENGVTPGDALSVIDVIAEFGFSNLNPATQEVDELFLDVNGDYRISPADALDVINKFAEDARREQVVHSAATAFLAQDDDDDDESDLSELDASTLI